jgi:hypothetical protein
VLRPQYYFRPSERGLLAWDVRRLVGLSRKLPVRDIALAEIAEVDENHWYSHGAAIPTCRSIVEHYALIEAADLSYPIILDAGGRVMDGMHRVCKALLIGIDSLPAVQFDADPEPDYVGREPESLPYD